MCDSCNVVITGTVFKLVHYWHPISKLSNEPYDLCDDCRISMDLEMKTRLDVCENDHSQNSMPSVLDTGPQDDGSTAMRYGISPFIPRKR
jgi:hypothetical protein